MNTIRFQAYDKRVKGVKYLKDNNHKFLVTISTEGYISVWEISDLIEKLPTLQNKLLALGDEFEALYHLNIKCRLLCLAAKLTYNSTTSLQQVVKPVPKGAKKAQKKALEAKVAKFGSILSMKSGFTRLKYFNMYFGVN